MSYTPETPTLSSCYRDKTAEEKLRDAVADLRNKQVEHTNDHAAMCKTAEYYVAQGRSRDITATEADEMRLALGVDTDSLVRLLGSQAELITQVEAYLQTVMATVTPAATCKPAETTPDGRPMNAPGAKADAGKNRLGLVVLGFAHSLEAVSRVGTDGAVKYSERGFLEVDKGVARYTDAMVRHFLAEETEGPLDASGHFHAAHLAWNALARLELMERERKGQGHVAKS